MVNDSMNDIEMANEGELSINIERNVIKENILDKNRKNTKFVVVLLSSIIWFFLIVAFLSFKSSPSLMIFEVVVHLPPTERGNPNPSVNDLDYTKIESYYQLNQIFESKHHFLKKMIFKFGWNQVSSKYENNVRDYDVRDISEDISDAGNYFIYAISFVFLLMTGLLAFQIKQLFKFVNINKKIYYVLYTLLFVLLVTAYVTYSVVFAREVKYFKNRVYGANDIAASVGGSTASISVSVGCGLILQIINSILILGLLAITVYFE